MKLLDRYILREILTPTLIAVVALTFVFFSRFIGRLLESILRQSANASDLWALSLAILPSVLTISIPMSVLVGILTGFGRMSSDSEVVALRAGGVSMKRILRPVLALGVLAWLVTLWLSVWMAPQAAPRLRALSEDILMKQGEFEVQPRVFNESLPNYVFYVQETLPDRPEWRGIMLANMTNPDEPQVTFADSAVVVRDEARREFQLTLSNGNTHVVSPLSPDKYLFSTFDSTTYTIAMPEAPAVPQQAPTTETPTRELWQRIRAGTATHEDRVEFHWRLALPFACLVFAIVGLPLGISTTRGGKSMGLVLSLVLMLVYYLVFIGGTRVAGEAQFSPLFAAWLANFGFAALGIFLLSRSDRSTENRGLAWLTRSIDWGTSRLSSVKLSRAQMSRWAYSLTHHSKFFRLLDIYVLRGFLFFFLLVLAVFVFLFIVVTLFELLPDIVRNNVDTTIVANYFIFLLPQIFYWVAPLAVLLAILITLGTLTKTNEILAVKAGAVSLYRMSMPLLVMALLLSAGIYFMQDFMLPFSNQQQDAYRNVIKGRAPQTYSDPNRKWIMGSDDRIYHYNYLDPEANVLGGVSIFEFEPGTFNLREWVFAARGVWNADRWVFENGWVRQMTTAQNVNFEPFATREFPDVDSPDYFEKEVRTAAQMTYRELRDYVQEMQQSGFDVTVLTLDLNRKLSFPMVTFIMAIIGIPFSFKTGRKGAFYGIGFCIAVGIAYWSMFELFDKLGGVNRLSPLIAAWFPNLIFGLSGIWMMLRVKT